MNKSVFLLAVIAFIPDGCTYGDHTPDAEIVDVVDRTVPEYEGQHWHERYINDACERCPDCCVQAIEDVSEDIVENCSLAIEEDVLLGEPDANTLGE